VPANLTSSCEVVGYKKHDAADETSEVHDSLVCGSVATSVSTTEVKLYELKDRAASVLVSILPSSTVQAGKQTFVCSVSSFSVRHSSLELLLVLIW